MNWDPAVGTAVCYLPNRRVAIVRQRVASDRYRVLWITGPDRGEMETLDLVNIGPLDSIDFETTGAALEQPVVEDPALERVRVQIKHSRNIARVTMLPEVRELIDAMCDEIEKAIKG